MTRADILKLLGAAGALAIVVALISPPTRPLPTSTNDWREQLPVKTGTPPPAASTTPVPPEALTRRPPPIQPKPEEEPEPASTEPSPQQAAVRYRDNRFPPDDIVARRFRQGYHWAERNDIVDQRDCFREPGDPFTDGCLAFMTDSDREPEYRPADGRFRRYRW